MSDVEEEESFGFYGKPLEQFDEDAHPKKRPISVEEQIATDAQGRRRFHGAFTGGFSAGFYNTVGSLEGWKPAEFKSSRSEKASNKIQRPEDYMDDEDVGEFGIAPQSVRATDDYNTNKKRKRQVFPDGPIPGDPVLHSLIESGNETIGYLLLRNMGYKHGDDEEEEMEPTLVEEKSQKTYGCEMPKAHEVKKTLDNIPFKVPDIYTKALANPKSNSFGLSYQGLDKSHIDLFTSSNLVVRERNNKKLSIAGQAFGVGAFEEDDDDIYVKEDLTKYDFELTSEKKKAPAKKHSNLVFDLFVISKSNLTMTEVFPPPTIPHSFSGMHKVRKSRFAPVVEEKIPKRHEIDAEVRAKYLGETEEKTYTPSNQQHKKASDVKEEPKSVESNEADKNVGASGLIFDRFVSASQKEDHLDLMRRVGVAECLHGTKDMRDAAQMKMFGALTRVTIEWLPNSLLCKRFNVPEPNYSETELKPRKRNRNLIFENEKLPIDTVLIDKPGLQHIRENPPEIPRNDPTIEIPEEAVVEAEISPTNIVVTKSHDHTEKLDVSKNIDLFKAIFQDSDDEEDAKEGENITEENKISVEESEKARDEEFKKDLLSEDFLLPKIKPMKEGILSDVGFIKFSIPEKKSEEIIDLTPEKPAEDLYGPKLPDKPDKIIFKKPVKISENTDADEKWVEKEEKRDKHKEHKHKKKHKKDKHKKKHKHKK